jgi:proteasome assembly chaperone (PAC2) family protein
MTISVTIKNKKAKKILEDLASLDLIEISTSKTITKVKKKERTLTHIASESSLAKTWNTKKEDDAWRNL